MKRRPCLLAAFAMLFAVPARQAAAEGGTWFDELMRRLAAIPARRASFSEEKSVAALTVPLISHGVLVYRRPNYLEKITTDPRPETLIVNGDQLSLATMGQKPRVFSLESQPVAAALVDSVRAALAGDVPGLQRFYRITASGGLTSWTLLLTPIAPSLARVLRNVTLTGAGTDIRGIRISEANGDGQSMTITEQR